MGFLFASITSLDCFVYLPLIQTFLNKLVAQSPLTSLNGLLYSTNNKAEAFADIFQDQLSPTFGTALPEVTNTISQIANDYIIHRDYTTSGKIELIIKNLPNRHALDIDQITNIALNNIKKFAFMNLTHILNASLRIRYCPQAWKKSLIMTIIKLGKDHSSSANYHSITLLSSMSKVFDKILLRKLTSAIGHKIRSEQFTFHTQHSITLQLLKITD